MNIKHTLPVDFIDDIQGELDMQVRLQYLPLINLQYQQDLRLDEDAQEYLHKEYRIKSTVSDQFELGYSTRKLHELIPLRTSQKGKIIRGALKRLKLLKAQSHERLNGCITVPVYWNDDLVAFYGERTKRARRQAVKYHWCVNNAPAVFNLESCKDTASVVMFSSPLKAIQYYSAFGSHVIATSREFCLTKVDCEVITSMGIERVYLAIEETDGGRFGLYTVQDLLAQFGIGSEVILIEQTFDYGTA